MILYHGCSTAVTALTICRIGCNSLHKVCSALLALDLFALLLLAWPLWDMNRKTISSSFISYPSSSLCVAATYHEASRRLTIDRRTITGNGTRKHAQLEERLLEHGSVYTAARAVVKMDSIVHLLASVVIEGVSPRAGTVFATKANVRGIMCLFLLFVCLCHEGMRIRVLILRCIIANEH